jgi:hypothetical protein
MLEVLERDTIAGREVRGRYFAFFVVGCAFVVGVVAMVETTHLQVANPALQVAAYQSAH